MTTSSTTKMISVLRAKATKAMFNRNTIANAASAAAARRRCSRQALMDRCASAKAQIKNSPLWMM